MLEGVELSPGSPGAASTFLDEPAPAVPVKAKKKERYGTIMVIVCSSFLTLVAAVGMLAFPVNYSCLLFGHPRMTKRMLSMLLSLQVLVSLLWWRAKHRRSRYLQRAKLSIFTAWMSLLLSSFTAVDFHWIIRLLFWHASDSMLLWGKYWQLRLIQKRLRALHTSTGCYMNTSSVQWLLRTLCVTSGVSTAVTILTDLVFFVSGSWRVDTDCEPNSSAISTFCTMLEVGPFLLLLGMSINTAFSVLANVVLVQPLVILSRPVDIGPCGITRTDLRWARRMTWMQFLPNLLSTFSAMSVVLAVAHRALSQITQCGAMDHEATTTDDILATLAPLDLTMNSLALVALSGVWGGLPRGDATLDDSEREPSFLPTSFIAHHDVYAAPITSLEAQRMADAVVPEPNSAEKKPEQDPAWWTLVSDLAHRGFTLGKLLDFYDDLGKVHMPWFDPDRSTTSDVVRAAIIPASRARLSRMSAAGDDEPGCPTANLANADLAMAVLLMDGQPMMPERMVTHNWSNLFCHLVAAIIADALEVRSYDPIAQKLKNPYKIKSVRDDLSSKDLLGTTYWVCAFSVNQHRGICGKSFESDKVSGKKHAVCACPTKKDFAGVMCEMNKFDDMMGFISKRRRGFRQVVAVDADFDLFSRAWCVAELVKAKELNIMQTMKLHSNEKLINHWKKLENVRVQKCLASRPEDKALILSKIPSFTAFNKELRQLILGSIQGWVDGAEQCDHLGRIVRSIKRQGPS